MASLYSKNLEVTVLDQEMQQYANKGRDDWEEDCLLVHYAGFKILKNQLCKCFMMEKSIQHIF